MNIYLGLEQPEQAAQILEILRLRGEANSGNLELLGNIYLNQDDFALSLEVFIEMMDSVDSMPEPEVPLRVATLFKRYGKTDASTALLAKIASKYAGQLDREQRLQLWSLQAQNARATGEMELAADLYAKVLEEDPANGEVLLELADYQADAGEMEKAYLLLDRAERLSEYTGKALRLKGQLLVREGKFSEAVVALDRAALATPEDNRLRDYLAEVRRAAQLSR